jgi:carboxypeptidase C (cathepsin A)
MQDMLGVDPQVSGNFSSCNNQMNMRFNLEGLEMAKTTVYHVEALLERGIRVLAYVGDVDFATAWVGIEHWTRELEWSGHSAFAGEELRPWVVDGAEAGVYRSHGPFTFATVKGAGHLVRR